MKEKERFEKRFKLLLDNSVYGSKLKNDTINKMNVGVLVDRLGQFKDFIKAKSLYMYGETRAYDTNKNFYLAIMNDIDMRGFEFDKFIDLRELSIDVICSRMKNLVDTTINSYNIVYKKE